MPRESAPTTMPPALHRLTAERRVRWDSEEELGLFLDGEPLDALLARLTGRDYLDNRSPTLLGCYLEEETALVLARVTPAPGATTRPHVLMCPDCCDLSCTTVVAEAVGGFDYVEWRRLGLDYSPWEYYHLERLGGEVEWFDGVGPFRFLRGEYEAVVAAFERERSRRGGTL